MLLCARHDNKLNIFLENKIFTMSPWALRNILFDYTVNLFQINARTELALRYNDISPLENHHCAVAFEILEKVRLSVQTFLSKLEF